MSLPQARERAQRGHPDLRAAQLRVEAAGARARQKALPPNPSLGVDVENVIGSGDYDDADVAETTLYVTQPLELFGKRGKRGRAADLERALAESEASMLRSRVDEQVTSAFAGVLAAQDRNVLASELVEVVVGLQQSIEQRADSGTSASSDLDRVRAYLAEARVELKTEQARLSFARAQLAIAAGMELQSLPPLVGDLERVDPPPELEPLMSWDGDSAVARLWQAKIDQRKAAVSYQRALRVPDVSVSAGYRRFSDTNDQAAVFYLSVPLPVFDQNRGEVDAASLELQETKALGRSAELRWQAEVLDAHRRLTTTHWIIEELRSYVPEASEVLSVRLRTFEGGRIDDFASVDSLRTRLRLRREYVDALESYHRSWAELRRLSASSPAP